MSNTKIEWCDFTWNPVFGCLNKCEYCYARKISFRFAKEFSKIFGISAEKFQKFEPVWIEKNFQKPIPKKATHIFVNSMSDVAYWEQDWIIKIFEKCRQYPEKKFLFLTKDIETVSEKFDTANEPENIKLGVTATCNNNLCHIVDEFGIDFLSIEPLEDRINIKYLYSFQQVIVGAETGNRKDKIIPKAEWIEEIREFCQTNKIKYFEKNSLKDIVNRPLIQERI